MKKALVIILIIVVPGGLLIWLYSKLPSNFWSLPASGKWQVITGLIKSAGTDSSDYQ